MLTQITIGEKFADSAVQQSLKIQAESDTSTFPKCNKPCPTCPWTQSLRVTLGYYDKIGPRQTSAMEMGFADAFRANPEAIWFCHNTVMPPNPNGVGGGIFKGNKPTVCGGFLEWREKENLAAPEGELIEIPERSSLDLTPVL